MGDESDIAGARETLHVPDDAGAYAEGLRRVLARIPDGWGRRIRCGPGWYPLVVDADRRLAAVDSGYVLQQVKEKFGVLVMYVEPSDFVRVLPPERRREIAAQLWAVTADVERLSATVCEMCGEPGEPTTLESGWLVTACAECSRGLREDRMDDSSG